MGKKKSEKNHRWDRWTDGQRESKVIVPSGETSRELIKKVRSMSAPATNGVSYENVQ